MFKTLKCKPKVTIYIILNVMFISLKCEIIKVSAWDPRIKLSRNRLSRVCVPLYNLFSHFCHLVNVFLQHQE